jgi:hypothetical protein
LNVQSERNFGTGSGVNAALRFGVSKRELLREFSRRPSPPLAGKRGRIQAFLAAKKQ